MPDKQIVPNDGSSMSHVAKDGGKDSSEATKLDEASSSNEASSISPSYSDKP